MLGMIHDNAEYLGGGNEIRRILVWDPSASLGMTTGGRFLRFGREDSGKKRKSKYFIKGIDISNIFDKIILHKEQEG